MCKISLAEARERWSAKLDEIRRAVGMLLRVKREGTQRGAEGKTPVTTACPEGR